jgi:hypothetical protein
MKGLHAWQHGTAVLALGALLVLPVNAPAAAACDDVAARGALNVLTINLLFSEVEMRDDRLREIAGFAAGNEVDVILLQEVVSGALVETGNSARDLEAILSSEQGLDYELQPRSRPAFRASCSAPMRCSAAATSGSSSCASCRPGVSSMSAARPCPSRGT